MEVKEECLMRRRIYTLSYRCEAYWSYDSLRKKHKYLECGLYHREFCMVSKAENPNAIIGQVIIE